MIPTVGTYQGDASNGVLPANQRYGNVSVGNGDVFTLDAGTYVIKSLMMKGSIQIASGPVTIYMSCQGNSSAMTFNGGGTINNATMKATNLTFMLGPLCTDSSLTGGSQSSFAVYAPDTDMKIAGNSDIYGAVVAKTITATGQTGIHYDRALASFGAGQFTCPPTEVSRASPIIATIAGSPYAVQGTYEFPYPTKNTLTAAAAANAPTAGGWKFSYIKGHLRARSTSSISTSASTYSSGSNLFDASTKLPAASDTCLSVTGACRRIFTNSVDTTSTTGLTVKPTLIPFVVNDATALRVGPQIVG